MCLANTVQFDIIKNNLKQTSYIINHTLTALRRGWLITAITFSAIFCAELGAQQKFPKTINISYIETPFNLQIMVMKERRMLESAFAELGINIRWHVFNTGAEQAQAMAAGSLDIASVINSTSVILANAAGNRVEIAALVSRPRQLFALQAQAGGPGSIRELRGKTIAGPMGSVLHQMLLAALDREGMKSTDVKFIHMGLPQARTALLSKRVDAALQAGNLIIINEEAGMRTICTAEGYLTPLLFTAVRPAFAKNYGELLEIYLRTQKEAYDWITLHTGEAVALGSRLQKIKPGNGMKLFGWSGIAKTMEDGDIIALSEDVDFLFGQKMIRQKINPRQFILPQAFGK